MSKPEFERILSTFTDEQRHVLQISTGDSDPTRQAGALQVGDTVIAPDLDGVDRPWRMIKQFKLPQE